MLQNMAFKKDIEQSCVSPWTVTREVTTFFGAICASYRIGLRVKPPKLWIT